MQLRISFVGPSGVGKSTAFGLAKEVLEARSFEVVRRDVALPLRQIQNFAYDVFDKASPGEADVPETFKQDGALLQALARHFEADLGPAFSKRMDRLTGANNVAVINTDCRNNTYLTLKALGFKFVRIEVSDDVLETRRVARGDLSKFNYQAAVEAYDQIVPTHVITNNGDLNSFQEQIANVINRLIS